MDTTNAVGISARISLHTLSTKISLL